MPLRAAKLVESQHVDVFDGITEGLADLRHVFDVLFGVGQARHEHKSHPDLLAGLGQSLAKIDGGLQGAAGDLVIGLLVAGFDVEQTQVDVLEHLVGVARVEEAGRVEAGVHAHLLGGMEHTRDEGGLHHGFAAGEGDTAMRGLEQVLVTIDLLDHGVKVDRLAVAHLPSVRVLAVLAAQRAAGHEHGHTGARSVHGGVDVPRVDEADITGFQGGKAVTSVESDWGFKAGKATHQSLRGIGLRFLEHMPGRGAERGCCGHRCPPVPNDAKVCGK